MHIPEIILEACQCYGACSTMKHSILVKRYYSPKSHSLPLYPLFYFLVVVFWEIGHLIVYKYFQMNIHVNNKIMMLLSCLSFLLPFFFFCCELIVVPASYGKTLRSVYVHFFY